MALLSNPYKLMKQMQVSQKYMDIYKNIAPILTDVSLRDGLYCEKRLDWPLSKKKDMLHEIVFSEKPHKIDVGSFASPLQLPIMGDTIQMYNYASTIRHLYEDSKSLIFPNNLEIYATVPCYSKLEEALNNNVCNMSFLTSCSKTFQKRNVNMDLQKTKEDLDTIFDVLKKKENEHITKKLYISCINECPFEGRIDIDYILHEIFRYNMKYELDEICLSDSCGTLSFEDYKYIVDALIYFGVLRSKIGVHLHVNTSNRYEMTQIVRYSLKSRITRFDVSLLHSAGSSMMNPKKKLVMSYDFFYGCLQKEMDSQYEYNVMYMPSGIRDV
jgi:hydroxymethylglutaryl-CoA lyase